MATDISMAAIQGQLTRLGDSIRVAARRSRRFSWFSWGFVFALVGGYLLGAVLGLLFPVVTTTITDGGTSTTTTFPVWIIPVALLPAIVVLALAVREAILGRREGLQISSPPNPAAPQGPLVESAGWTEQVRQSQQLITHMKNETEISFLPLFLGTLGLAEVLVGEAIAASSAGTLTILLVPLVAVPFLLPLVPLYWVTRQWIRGYQAILNRHVGELTRLESDFFARFAGVAGSG